MTTRSASTLPANSGSGKTGTGRSFVVDNSALVKTVVDEEHSAAFRHWLTEMQEENADLLAPYLLRYEFGNILARIARTRPDWTPEVRERILQNAFVGFRFVDGEKASQWAPPCTYYDAAYVALARAARAELVTYDETMAAVARDSGVGVVTPGLKAPAATS